MRNGWLRGGVALLLVASGVWAAVTVGDLGQRAATPDALGARLDSLAATVSGLGLAQADYLMPGQDATPALGRFSRLLADATAATAELGPSLHTDAGAHALDAFADRVSALAESDTQARERLFLGDLPAAAQVITGPSRVAVSGMQTALHEMHAAEAGFRDEERRALLRRAATILASVGLLWMFGLLAMVSGSPRAGPEPKPAVRPAEVNPVPDRRSVDIEAAAALCMEIARVETPDGVDALVRRAGDLLGASRLILWVGGGEALFPVMTHGGAANGRPAPVRRDADHPAARAWRRAAAQTVSSDAGSAGEICAPMVGPSGCSGVLAVQVGSGREADALLRGVVTMIAAQLSTVVTGLPATGAAAPAATAATGA
jgi:hypothetical protein